MVQHTLRNSFSMDKNGEENPKQLSKHFIEKVKRCFVSLFLLFVCFLRKPLTLTISKILT